MTEPLSLNEYIENLLRRGLRSKDEEFQVLIRVFGEAKIKKMAQEILEAWKKKKDE
jgi:spore maturation protein SpmB